MADDDARDGGANSVLGKARLILEAFELDDDSLTLTEIVARTGISKATVHRLNQELLEWGMLERIGLEYRLGMRAFELGSRVPRFRVLRDAVRPYMESLHHQTREAVHLAVLDGLEVLYLEKVAGAPQSARPSRIAGRLPLHSTATGKVLLAFGQPSLVEEVIGRGPLQRVTPTTIVLPVSCSTSCDGCASTATRPRSRRPRQATARSRCRSSERAGCCWPRCR